MKTKKIECKGCKSGVAMCYRRPCWGTIDDFRAIIKAGHADKLMIDYYNSDTLSDNKRIYFLSGANNGNEGSKADWNPKGKCIFLENDLCVIHEIKPTMGAVSCCKVEGGQRNEMEQCIKTWDSEDGEKLISEWKLMVDYVDKDDDEGFSFESAFSTMLYGF
jgi:hypothetical protein